MQLLVMSTPAPPLGDLMCRYCVQCILFCILCCTPPSFSSIKIKFRASVSCKCIVFASILCCNFLLHTVFSGLKTGENYATLQLQALCSFQTKLLSNSMKIIPQTNISNKVVLLHSNVLIGSDNNDKSQCYSHILLGPLVIIYYFGKKEKVNVKIL